MLSQPQLPIVLHQNTLENANSNNRGHFLLAIEKNLKFPQL